jgi:hypothetical protein
VEQLTWLIGIEPGRAHTILAALNRSDPESMLTGLPALTRANLAAQLAHRRSNATIIGTLIEAHDEIDPDELIKDINADRAIAGLPRVAILLGRPEHRGAALSRELAEIKSAFNYRAREIAGADQQKRFDELATKAAQEIVRGRPGFETAERQLAEMRAVMHRVLWFDPAFIADVFNSFAADGHLAIDSAAHERLVEIGRQALLRGDVAGLRDVVFEMYDNRISLPAGGSEAAALATIMRSTS